MQGLKSRGTGRQRPCPRIRRSHNHQPGSVVQVQLSERASVAARCFGPASVVEEFISRHVRGQDEVGPPPSQQFGQPHPQQRQQQQADSDPAHRASVVTTISGDGEVPPPTHLRNIVFVSSEVRRPGGVGPRLS